MKKGFTLIELLIVVAIIGVLASLFMANFIGVRQRARDAQRKSDLRQIQSALELYRADQGAYPAALPSCNSRLAVLTTVYMQKVPCDPGGVAYNNGNYFYVSGGTTYTVAACLENAADSDPNKTLEPPGGGTCGSGAFYVLRNP